MASTIERLSGGVGEALSAVMLALLELPRFENEQYFRLLGEVLARLPEGVTVSEAMERYGVRFPARPLAGEVRARLEAALVEDSTLRGGLRLALPAGTGEGRFGGGGSLGGSLARRGSAVVAVEIAARYHEPRPFDFSALADLTAPELLKLAGLRPPERNGGASAGK